MTTFTSSLRLWQGQPLDPSIKNAWGTFLNTNDTLIDNAITGVITVSLNGMTNYTLTTANGAPDEARPLVQNFIGTLPGDCTVNLPQVQKIGWAINATVGGRNVILAAGTGGGAVIPPDGAFHFYFADGGGNVSLPNVGFGGIAITNLNIPGTVTVGALISSGAVTATSLAISGTASVGALTTAGTVSVAAPGQGGVVLTPGGAAPGYLAITSATGARVGYVGYTDGGVNHLLQAEAPFTGWTCGGNFIVTGILNPRGRTNLGTGALFYLDPQLDAETINFATSTFIRHLNIPGAILQYSAPAGHIFDGNVTLNSSLSVAGTATIAGLIHGTATSSQIGTQFVYTAVGGTPFAGPVGASALFDQWAVGFGFAATSDGRIKSKIEDLTIDEARVWVRSARSRKYFKDGRQEYGFVAQEDLTGPRANSILSHPSDDPRFLLDETGMVPRGHRLHKDYNQEIAPLVTVVQDLMAKIVQLEDRIAAMEANLADP